MTKHHPLRQRFIGDERPVVIHSCHPRGALGLQASRIQLPSVSRFIPHASMDGWQAVHPWTTNGHGSPWHLRLLVRVSDRIPSPLRLRLVWVPSFGSCRPSTKIFSSEMSSRPSNASKYLRFPQFGRWEGGERSRGKDPIRWGLDDKTNGNRTIDRFRTSMDRRRYRIQPGKTEPDPLDAGGKRPAKTRRGRSL